MTVRVLQLIPAAKHLAMAAFTLVTFGLSTQAHAFSTGTYVVRLDNKMTCNYPKAKSGATVEVCLKPFGQPDRARCETRVLDSISQSHDFFFVDIRPWHDVFIKILPGNNDTDLLVIDQFELWYDVPNHGWEVLRTRGVDNQKGECFSSQSSDFSNVHCANSGHIAGTSFNWVI
ncbi:MAG: hypothetical protein OXU20_13245 [Myxococcales bacterium]|nr:hypothetical protein [Myxococcales bacterium]MDD9968435.1 hypothetical protein [Myxococcales bacterium]